MASPSTKWKCCNYHCNEAGRHPQVHDRRPGGNKEHGFNIKMQLLLVEADHEGEEEEEEHSRIIIRSDRITKGKL